MDEQLIHLDVLCVGTAAYDLIFSIDDHLGPDEKRAASDLVRCGGGPAANAAVTICRQGHSAAFAGYLGRDLFGDENLRELAAAGVRTELVARGPRPTPLSAILVKPDGRRSLVYFRGAAGNLASDSIDFSSVWPKVILFDGHEPHISIPLADFARKQGIPIILDAGSVQEGTVELAKRCDHLVCAERFATDYTGAENEEEALDRLAGLAPTVVVTLGDRGAIWARGQERGRQPAFAVEAIDTTGAGDIFHGAYAAALIERRDWLATLRYASAAAALCCTKIGARLGVPSKGEVEAFLASDPPVIGGG
ncbi:MAG: carbohydrate kinase [Chloroflexota bacterium]|nr:MAG: carbohydrate kinase [Chloroflexota bacterium]